jgi:hypothetical protein
MTRHMIFARAANGVIGATTAMPWHLPEDLAHFKRLTLGAPVIMGRKTWDSLPPRFRPLPGRRNIVVTRQARLGRQAGAERASAGRGDGAVPRCGRAWVIGGAEIYAQAMPLAGSPKSPRSSRTSKATPSRRTLGPGMAGSRARAPRFGLGPCLQFRHLPTTTEGTDMSGGGFHVHGPHDHELEHAAQHAAEGHGGGGMINQIAMFTAVIATVGAIFAYMGGATQANAGLYKNNAAIKKTEASNQWNYFQAKSTKQSLAEVSRDLAPERQQGRFYQAKIDRYEKEKKEIETDAARSRPSPRTGTRRATRRCTSTTAGPRPPPRCRWPSRWPPSRC